MWLIKRYTIRGMRTRKQKPMTKDTGMVTNYPYILQIDSFTFRYGYVFVTKYKEFYFQIRWLKDKVGTNIFYQIQSETRYFVSYGCKTWSLTFIEKHRLKVFEKKVLRRILDFREEVQGEWRGNLWAVPFNKYWGDQIKMNEMGGTCRAYRGQESCIQGLGGDLMEREHLKT